MLPYSDRTEAGRELARSLVHLKRENPVIIALPRGGLPVAFEVAKALGGLDLDVAIVRKVGHPMQPEYGIGAMSEDDFVWMDPTAGRGIDASELERILVQEATEIQRRVHEYRNGRPPINVEGRTVVIVDDGLATGVTARAAAHLMRSRGARRIVLAVPVCSPDAGKILEFEKTVDEFLCPEQPQDFYSVGQWYIDFHQVKDAEVVEILKRARAMKRSSLKVVPKAEEVSIQKQEVTLSGTLVIPENALGLVIFAHGSGSGRFSPRNRMVANRLNEAGFATLLFDLLTEDESLSRSNVFDIPLLGTRLLMATRFVHSRNDSKYLPIGYFGASTGAAAALWAAAQGEFEIAAIVSRGGRPDLASPLTRKVTAPTLLIVGGDDVPVIELNQVVLDEMANADLVIIPGATHLFQEPGTLEAVANHAISWFGEHFRKTREKRPKAA